MSIISKSCWSVIVSWILLSVNQVAAHPGLGLVADKKGNIYYTDLQQVWKIRNGKKSIAVPKVHTHELFIDADDNLVGEHLWYAGDESKKFYHYLWKLDKEGNKVIIVPESQAYVNVDFSMARDKAGSEYYCKFTDSMHLYKRNASRKEQIVSAFDFRGVRFFLPQANGDVFFTKHNTVFRVLPDGKIQTLAKNIGKGANAMPWGVWKGRADEVYVAVFNEGVIKKISSNGEVSEFYKSEKGWAPAHGLFDTNNRLWVLEWSEKNEVRVKMMGKNDALKKKPSIALPLGVGVAITLAIFIAFRQKRK